MAKNPRKDPFAPKVLERRPATDESSLQQQINSLKASVVELQAAIRRLEARLPNPPADVIDAEIIPTTP